MNAPDDPPTPESPLRPPTVEASAWASSALQAARDLRARLNRLTIDHRRELLPAQADELAAARNHAAAAVGVLGVLSRQLRQATAPPAPAGAPLPLLPPGWAPDEADAAAELKGDLEYDATTNAF